MGELNAANATPRPRGCKFESREDSHGNGYGTDGLDENYFYVPLARARERQLVGALIKGRGRGAHRSAVDPDIPAILQRRRRNNEKPESP